MRNPMHFTEPLCIEIGSELFFPEGEARVAAVAHNEAKKVCNLCKHLDDCAQWAIKHELYGVWGATTPLERQEIRKQYGIVRVKPEGEIVDRVHSLERSTHGS
jgi:hypothetical protein